MEHRLSQEGSVLGRERWVSGCTEVVGSLPRLSKVGVVVLLVDEDEEIGTNYQYNIDR